MTESSARRANLKTPISAARLSKGTYCLQLTAWPIGQLLFTFSAVSAFIPIVTILTLIISAVAIVTLIV